MIATASLLLLAALAAEPLAPPSGDAEGAPAAAAGTAEILDFARDVRPILARNCWKCHGPDRGTRQADLRLDDPASALGIREHLPGGAAIVPGDSAASELIRRVSASDPDERMPPPEAGDALDAAAIATLRRWIDGGAAWPPHWAFEAPRRPEVPRVEDARGFVRTPVDAFVLRKLREAGLEPAPEADLALLARRAALAITGLPPQPEDVDRLLADDAPDAYERFVDRLLHDPAYGEHMATGWLDLARYADSKGFAQDEPRSIWRYRDWVVDAFDADLPYDRFTVEQLAGDLLPAQTKDQLVATAFHRNTLNNDEGGTDDEEFRVAAVVDRVNTTMTTWLGLTAGCAQCHDHKFDPISHVEYYQLFDFFNQSEDADRPDERPTILTPTPDQQRALDGLEAELNAARCALDAAAAPFLRLDPQDLVIPPDFGVDEVLLDDLAPAGAVTAVIGPVAAWDWVGDDTAPIASGERALRASGNCLVLCSLTGLSRPPLLQEGDRLFVSVLIDPLDPPDMIGFQFADGVSQEHRGYFGASRYEWGLEGGASRRRLGELPPAGRWTRLEIPLSAVGLAPGDLLQTWSFDQFGGTAYFDLAGIRRAPPPQVKSDLERYRGGDRQAQERLLRFAIPRFVPGLAALFAPHHAEVLRLERELQAATRDAPRTPVMAELPPERRRESHVLLRGNFLDRGRPVTAGVPALLPPLEPRDPSRPADRLDLARWIASPSHPLTARVQVDRLWRGVFGVGLVATPEDFGTQGEPPSHPELLDWLATEYVRAGWSTRSLVRLLVTSSTFRQSSTAGEASRTHDPDARLYSRYPRPRLGAEQVRDQALAAAGLLCRTRGGPPVRPPQPATGLKASFGTSVDWEPSQGADRWRRGLYVQRRRTIPYPTFGLFDAGGRESCQVVRVATNTPLQALATWNDPAFVEAAQALARRARAEGDGDAAAIARRAFRLVLLREPDDAEVVRLVLLHDDVRARYDADPDAARLAATDPLGAGVPAGTSLPAAPADAAGLADLAAWTVVAATLLNLDETVAPR